MTKQQARAPIHKITKGQTQAAIDAGATHAEYRNKGLNKRLMKNRAKVAREQERRENHFALARKIMLSDSQKRALHGGNPQNKRAGRNKLTDMMASNLMNQLPPGTVSFEPHDVGARGQTDIEQDAVAGSDAVSSYDEPPMAFPSLADVDSHTVLAEGESNTGEQAANPFGFQLNAEYFVNETAAEPGTAEQVSEAIKASPFGLLVNAAKVAMEAGDVPRTVQEALMANAMAPLSPGDFTKEFEREHGEQGQAGDQHFEPTAEGTESQLPQALVPVEDADGKFARPVLESYARGLAAVRVQATDGGGDELVPANINEVRLAIAEAPTPVAAVMQGIVDHAENLTAIKNDAMNLQSFGRLHSDPREVVDGDFLRKHPEVSDGLAASAGAPKDDDEAPDTSFSLPA